MRVAQTLEGDSKLDGCRKGENRPRAEEAFFNGSNRQACQAALAARHLETSALSGENGEAAIVISPKGGKCITAYIVCEGRSAFSLFCGRVESRTRRRVHPG